jgi:hypothetical protein
MVDTVVGALQLGLMNCDNISFKSIREYAKTDHGLKEQLGYGRSILSSTEELDQYLYSYGPMIESQWETILANVQIEGEKIEVADYGCGQGLATVMLLDKFRHTGIEDNILRVHLIEPSLIALTRAVRILQCYCPDVTISPVGRLLDDVELDDLEFQEDSIKIHLFSNILDIDDFDEYELMNKVFKIRGTHYILAVSPDREFAGGSPRLIGLFEEMNSDRHKKYFIVKENTGVCRFTCQNGQPAIAFGMHVEI